MRTNCAMDYVRSCACITLCAWLCDPTSHDGTTRLVSAAPRGSAARCGTALDGSASCASATRLRHVLRPAQPSSPAPY